MKKHMIVAVMLQAIALTAFATSLRAVEAVGIQVGGMEIIPAIQLGSAHDDNISAQETLVKSSWITTIDPTVALKAVNGANEYELSYQLSEGIYHSSHNDDFTDHFVGFDARLGLSSRLNIDAWADYSNTHDRRGSTFTGLPIALIFATPDEYHETVVGAEVDYGLNAHVVFSGEYSNKRYDNNQARTQARDLDITGGTAEFSYLIAPKTSAVVEARYKRFDYKLLTPTFNLDSNEQRYYAGLDWEATAKTTGTVRVGYLKKDFSRVGLIDDGFVSWEVGVVWEPMTYSSWAFETSSTALETDGTGSFTKSTGGSVEWNHEWNEHLSHKASSSYFENEFQGVIRNDKITSVGISADYQLMRWLTVQPGYNFTNRNSNVINASFRQNVWSINLIGTL